MWRRFEKHDGGRLLPGAFRRAGFGLLAGVALALNAPLARAEPCPDLNGDGFLDQGDISAFVANFLAADLRADFNDDGFLDNGDIGAFIALFLSGAPCTPELRFVGGATEGTVSLGSATPPTFLAEHYLADPSSIGPLPDQTGNATVYAAGTDTDGTRVLVTRNTSRREFIIHRETSPRQVYPIAGDGVHYPSAFNTLQTDDPEFMYEPFAARVHDGLVIALCNVHWYKGNGDPSQTLYWDTSNTVGVLWKNLDDATWNIIRDSHNPTFGQYGAVWALGIPIVPDPNTLLVGWTNYQWKFEWNGPNEAFLSRFNRGPDGRWTHAVSLNLLEDGSAPANQHYHTVQPYWTGAQLRVFLPIGDAVGQNGIYEFYRDDLDLSAGVTPKPGAREISLPGTGWTDAGFIQGGDAFGGFNRPGMQPTYMLPLNSRLYCGGDEAFPAIVSFDPNRPGGTPIDDLRPEYLPHPPDIASGLGWVSLIGDVDDYTNPTTAAVMVQPSASWDGLVEKANRVVYFDGKGWASVAHVETRMTYGVCLGPEGTIFVGSSTGGASIVPGTLTPYTPLISSPGAANAITDPDWFATIVGGTRASVVDITDQPELIGPNDFLEGTQVLRVRVNTNPLWAGAPYATLAPWLDNREMLAEGDNFQFRYWLRPLGKNGLMSKVIPIKAETNEYLMASEAGAALGTTARPINATTNAWTEFLEAGRVISPLGTLPFGFGVLMHTHSSDGLSAEFDYDLAIEGLYVNATDFVSQRPAFGQSLPATQNLIPLSSATLPITVKGVTMPLGQSSEQNTVALNYTRNLCTLRVDADNYLSIDAYFEAGSIRYFARIDGQNLFGKIADATWTRATPVSFRFESSGADLLVSASVYGGPWTTPVTLPGLGARDWQQFELFGASGQSHLGLASFEATPK